MCRHISIARSMFLRWTGKNFKVFDKKVKLRIEYMLIMTRKLHLFETNIHKFSFWRQVGGKGREYKFREVLPIKNEIRTEVNCAVAQTKDGTFFSKKVRCIFRYFSKHSKIMWKGDRIFQINYFSRRVSHSVYTCLRPQAESYEMRCFMPSEIYFVEHSTSWEANSLSADHKTPRLL